MDWALLVVIASWLSISMTFAWGIQRATGLSGWIDTIWSGAVGAGGIIAAVFANGAIDRRIAILAIITGWALRLASHIGARTRGGEEDPRYAKLVDQWGDSVTWRLFVFLQIQALAGLVLVSAVYLSAANQTSFPQTTDLIAVVVAISGLCGGAISDAQLNRFRKTPHAKSEVCEIGLWRYSRHPNYFFEWMFWCCWPLFALSTPVWGWLSFVAPLLMYWLLVHVYGIPPLEDHMLRSRGEKFRALQRRVNAFFPGPRNSHL